MVAFIRCGAVSLTSLLVAACSSNGGAKQQLPATATGNGADAGGGDLTNLADAATTEAYQMSMTAFDVAAGTEVYKCQDFDNPFGKDIAIVKSESVMVKGGHHFAAFRISGLTAAPLMDCPAGGLEAHEFIHASQQLDQVTPYPENVGRFLPAGDGIRLMVHFLNATGAAIHVPATTFSMSYVDPDKIQYKAAAVFLNNVSISVPPGQSSLTKSFKLPSDIKLLVAVSHMHEHAVGFTSSTSDNRMIYQSTQWNEPLAASFDPPMEIAGGTSITWTCSFQNDTGKTLVFGQSASQNEMCIFNGVYYPSPDGSSIVQNLF
jgi:hypothetical protein